MVLRIYLQLEQKEKGCPFWQIIILNKEKKSGWDILLSLEYPCFGRNSRPKKTQKWILECQVLDAIHVVPLSAKGRVLPM
jgi:hypothetical protein